MQLSLVDRVGSRALGVFELAGAIATFGAHAIVEAARPPYELREIVRHGCQSGYRSPPLILAAGFAIGVVLSMHTRASLERFGAEAMIPAALAIALIRENRPLVGARLDCFAAAPMIPAALAIALIREAAPLVAALLVAGRVGAGIGAEIG